MNVTLCGKRDFENVIKLKILRLSWIIQLGPMEITRVLIKKPVLVALKMGERTTCRQPLEVGRKTLVSWQFVKVAILCSIGDV